jgi:hypothetical protein
MNDLLNLDSAEMKTPSGKSVLGVGAPPGEALDVFINDQTSSVVMPYLVREISETSFASEATIDSNSVTLAAGHGVVVGDIIVIKGQYIGRVLTVAGNVVTLNQRFNITYPAGTVAFRTSPNMAIDGSVTPVVFGLESGPGIKFDLYKLRIAFRGTVDMDDAKFASLTALTNGLFVRAKLSASRYNNYFNARSNSEFHLRGKVTYSAKAPAGSYGMVFEFPLHDDNGVAFRVNHSDGARLEIIVQDNLSGLTYMEATVSGHLVEE